MKKLLAGLSALTLASGAFAAATCPAYPKSEWMSEADAKTKIEGMGYQIKKFKVSGNCYEIYGHDKAGKKVEIYFDAKNLNIVKRGD
jgi:hypothetical protein